MLKKVLLYDLLISGIYISSYIVDNQKNVFSTFIIFLIYFIFRVLIVTLELFYSRLTLLKLLLIGLIVLVGSQFYLVTYYLVLNIMNLNEFQKKTRVMIALFSILLIAVFFQGETYLFIIISLFTVISMYVIETLEDRLAVIQVTKKEYYNQIQDMKLVEILNARKEDEISTISRLEERNEIAQQLHDKLGHVLSGNIIQLEAANLLMDKDQGAAKDKIEQVMKHLRLGMDDIRALLKHMKPETASLNINRVKSLITETEKQSGIKIQLSYDECISDLDFNAWRVVLYNIRECLTNMMKYSKATTCQVSFTQLNTKLRIMIEDNGVGSRNINKGMGIYGIEERLEAINGQLIIDGTSGFKTIMLIDVKGVNYEFESDNSG